MGEKSTKIKDFFEKISKIHKILPFFDKINPYREIRINPDTLKVVDTKVYVYYHTFVQWIVNIILNGIFCNFILYCWNIQPINYILVLGDGVTIWFISQMISKLYEGYIDGKIRIGKFQ